MDVVVVVEVSMASWDEYEMDHDLGRLGLDRMLFTSARYPADYGYVPVGLAEDGDPPDALVMLGEPTILLRARRGAGGGVSPRARRRLIYCRRIHAGSDCEDPLSGRPRLTAICRVARGAEC
jgi:hypothetical protein